MGASSKGLDYADEWASLRHPLTPYRTGTNEGALKGKELSGQYEDWRGVAVEDEERDREVARTVDRYRDEARPGGIVGDGALDYVPTLQVFGFDNDQASVYVWNENEFPLAVFRREDAATLIKALLAGARKTRRDLFDAVRRYASKTFDPDTGEWKDTGLDFDLSNSDEGVFDDIESRFMSATEPAFREACRGLSGGKEAAAVAETWADALEREALEVFDRYVSMEQRGTDREAILARRELSNFARINAMDEMTQLTEERL
jgi:hypothetical protein